MRNLNSFLRWLLSATLLLLALLKAHSTIALISVLVIAFLVSPLFSKLRRHFGIKRKLVGVVFLGFCIVAFAFYMKDSEYSVDQYANLTAEEKYVVSDHEASGDDFKESILSAADEVSFPSWIESGASKIKSIVSGSDSTEEESDYQQVELVRVVDGDTIVVKQDGSELKVRLIGVNTPESVSPDEEKNSEEGDAASEYLKTYLSDVTSLYLQSDVSDVDIYDRVLRYVWMEIPNDPYDIEEVRTKMLNGILVNEKIAEPVVYEPNVAYKDIFEQIYDGE